MLITSWMIPGIEKSMIKKGGLYIPAFYAQARSDKWTDINYIQSLYDATVSEKETSTDLICITTLGSLQKDCLVL